jgi:hypothetical protein
MRVFIPALLIISVLIISGCSESMMQGEIGDEAGPMSVLGAFLFGESRAKVPVNALEHNGSLHFDGFGNGMTKKFFLNVSRVKFSYVNLGRSQFRAVLMNSSNEEVFEIVQTIDPGEDTVTYLNGQEGYYYIQISSLDGQWEIDFEN